MPASLVTKHMDGQQGKTIAENRANQSRDDENHTERFSPSHIGRDRTGKPRLSSPSIWHGLLTEGNAYSLQNRSPQISSVHPDSACPRLSASTVALDQSHS